MTIERFSVSGTPLAEYAAISIAFEAHSALSPPVGSGPWSWLSEHHLEHPYVKDYDAIAESPIEWPAMFNTSHWALFLATIDEQRVGGATVALQAPDAQMFEGRRDLAVLWDIRVVPAFRRTGVGRRLVAAAEAWVRAQGCRELKVETQDINVGACRFYAAMGFELRTAHRGAYAICPEETQLLWYKALPKEHMAS